ncbi:family 20 glycosylhydrolase [Saccharicrinis carchari]|nr:family 20 glycosylhydrolase [Saccharicrinis carchari]
MKHLLFINLFVALLLASCATPSFEADQVALIPKPDSFTLHEQSFRISASTPLFTDNEKQRKATDYLNFLLDRAAGFELAVQQGEGSKGVVFQTVDGMAPEAYRLEVNPSQILVQASGEAGFFYGVQSIRQLLPIQIESKQVLQAEWLVPSVVIEDQPRFEWRGMHMDFSRHFFTLDEVKEFLDYMALYKLNTFHMHLTDDQGWRIEIKKYPLLTEKGAWRKENDHDKTANRLAKTDETFKMDQRHYRNIDGERKYGGFFTQEQIKEIIKYADERCITVMPEIDMPGHFKSAIDNYPYLSCTGEAGWGEVFSTPACVGKETTYEFMENILAEVAELFPYEYIHIGGDEVNTKSWEDCPRCQREMRKQGLKTEHELQTHFNHRIEAFLHSKGKRLMGWDEIAEGGLTPDASIMWWRNWAPTMLNVAADNGSDIVITPDFEYYFDFTYEATPVQKTYDYEPIPEDFTPEQAKHILGVQANIWTEWIPNFTRLQYQTFPRLQALAETGWSEKEAKDFEDFTQRLLPHYDRMDVMGIHYYIPAVEGLNKKIAFIDSAMVTLEVPLQGVEIRYTLDGSQPTKEDFLYTGPFAISKNATIKARGFRGKITGEVSEAEVEKQSFREAVNVDPQNKGLQRWFVENKFKVVEEVKLPPSPKWTHVDKPDMGEHAALSLYSMVFKGYFKAEKDGMYEFAVTSDDGSLLYFGDKLIVDNGGNHAALKRSGMVALKKGWHPITLFFHQAGGGGELNVTYAAPGEAFKELDGSAVGY